MRDETDRRIINGLQGGFPVEGQPFAALAPQFGISEDELIERIDRLCRDGWLSRFGPMYDAERLGGNVCLAALAVPTADFERVAAQVNAHPEIAHNYQREHSLNMWFVVATEDARRIDDVLATIEAETGLSVFAMPKLEEFFIGFSMRA